MKIGLDIGGSYIRGILMSDKGIDFCYKTETPKNKKDFTFAIKRAVLENIKFAGNVKIKHIGIGIAGVSDLKSGVLFSSPNIKFLKNFKIKEILEKEFGISVFINNDARCFTMAELKLGAAKGFKNVLGITLGTGVGGGMAIGGEIYYGDNFSAGEVGHMVIGSKVKSQKSKDYQTFEDLASKKFLKGRKPNSEFLNYLAIGIANLINILDPEIVILGGGISKELFVKDLAKVKKIATKLIISPKSRNFKLNKGKLGEYAGAIGAALIS